MDPLDVLDKRLRIFSVIILVIAISLLFIWFYFYITSPEDASPLILAISIALLLAGILLFTRIQYIIWVKKKY